MKRLFFVTIIFSFSLFLCAQSNLTFMTEAYPPYNYQENGKLQGIAIDMMSFAFKEIDSNLSVDDIKLMPWARSYNLLQEKPYHVLFSTTRSTEREKLFKWVGPISPTKIVVIARKKSQIKIDSFADLNQYKIGVINEDIGQQILLKNGIKKEQLDAVAKADFIINKLNIGRNDLWAYEENVAYFMIKKHGFNPDNYETVFVLSEADLYVAFNKETPDNVVKKFQKAFDKMNKENNGLIKKEIMKKYLK